MTHFLTQLLSEGTSDYFLAKVILLSLCRALWRILRAKMENLAGENVF